MKTRLILLAAVSATTLMANGAWAQDQEEGTAVEELVVTGARAPRSRLDTVSPVDVVTGKEMAQQGTTETAQALANLVPSIDFPRPSITDGTDSIRPATMRGLAPDQTLVLVNSVRQHASALVNLNGSIGRGSAAVDLNTIPMAALSTVEVLREGASAQYGSDAIAGVINMRLRQADSGGNFSLSAGIYDTEVKPARIPEGYHRNDGAVVEVSGWRGFKLGAEGFLTVSAELRNRQPTSRADLDPREPAPLKIRSRYGDAETRDATIFFNAGMPINPTWQAYGWLGYQYRETESAATGRNPSNAGNVRAVYPDGFIPKISPTITDLTAVGGVRGDVDGWQIDTSLSYGKNKIHYYTTHSINASIGPTSPTDFDSGTLEYAQTLFNIDVVKPLSLGSLESTTLAFGGEYRDENYQIGAGDTASWQLVPTPTNIGAGAQGFIGFRPANNTDQSRHSLAAYADLDLRLTKSFDVDVAVRYEDYSDFGSTTTGKIAARYDFTDSFAIRGAVSTGFRAPALQQQAFTSTAINFINLGAGAVPLEIVTLRATDPVAISLGAKPLTAEESVNYSAGFVFHKGPFELTVDAYQIDVDDRIVLSENLTVGTDPTGMAIYNLLNPTGGTVGGGRFFINGVDTTTKGLDIIAHYRWAPENMGRFNFTLAANFNDTEVTRVPAIPTSVPIPNPPPLFNRINILTFEEGTPHTKVVGSVDWNGDKWGGMVRATYYEGILHPFSNATTPAGLALDVYTGDHTLIDVEGRYRFSDKFTWTAGISNLFDEYPNPTQTLVNTNGALAWSNYSPFGFNGRYLYTRLSVDF